MIQEIPLDSLTPDYEFNTVLAGSEFILRVRWNERDAAWFMDISTPQERTIATGLKLVIGALIGFRIVDDEKPDGVFQVADLSGNDQDAGFDDMGSRVRLYFIDTATLEAE